MQISYKSTAMTNTIKSSRGSTNVLCWLRLVLQICFSLTGPLGFSLPWSLHRGLWTWVVHVFFFLWRGNNSSICLKHVESTQCMFATVLQFVTSVCSTSARISVDTIRFLVYVGLGQSSVTCHRFKPSPSTIHEIGTTFIMFLTKLLKKQTHKVKCVLGDASYRGRGFCG